MAGESGPAALPRYVQIAETLIRDIASGRLADGARLAPEREMAADLGVSVGTLRRALDSLAEKGLLERVQGSGNYVRHRADVGSVYAMFRLERVGGGGLPTAELLEVARLPKPSGAPAFGPSAQAHRFRRLRALDGQPVALEEIWLDAARAPDVAAEAISESLYLWYRAALGLVVARAEDRVGLGAVPGWAPARFPLPPGAACGCVERLARDPQGRAMEFSRTWFDHERARYVARLGKG